MRARTVAFRAPPQVSLRPAEEVLRLRQLGHLYPTRLSFTRCLVRRMAREHWRFTRPLFELDAQGYGRAVYRVETPGGVVGFAAFSHELDPAERTDRVIAERWDTTFSLRLGELDAAELARLEAQTPLQERGRFGPREIVLSRANRSVRFFEALVERLASGGQPEPEEVARVGYLLRTTAVYGNGKFGMADLDEVWRSGIFGSAFEAEMLTVYLVRLFGFDLVEHVARCRAPARAVRLAPRWRRALGVGNATGLGMAPFLISHPRLLDRWIRARETALARVRAVDTIRPAHAARLRELLRRAIRHIEEWHTGDPRQAARLATTREELSELLAEGPLLARRRPWDALWRRAETAVSPETRELLASLLIELHPERVDDLATEVRADETQRVDPTMRLGELRELVRRRYGWALSCDFSRPEAGHFFWYVSEEKLEPRLGERREEPGADREMPVDVARQVTILERELEDWPADLRVARFLLARPQFRRIVRRIQSLRDCDYGEVRDNLLGREMVPVDLLRAKLAVFGATRFDPKSDRWLRITLFQGAPLPEELGRPDADDWAFATVGGVE